MKLEELKPGKKGRVIKISGDSLIKRRILDMGITKGTEIEVEQVAPLGDPIKIKVRGYSLSLRKEEAAKIFIKVEYEEDKK